MQAQIINLFLEIMDTEQLGLVLISHDLAVVRHLTDRIIVMQHGRVVEQGETRQVLEQPTHPYTRNLVSDVSWSRAG